MRPGRGTGDAALAAAARAGDREAFGALLRRHYPMVHGLCTRVLGDADAARDVVQEAAVTAMLALDRLRRDDRFAAWLAGIALNLCRRLLRERDWAAFSLDAIEPAREPADPSGGPAEIAETAEVARRVQEAVRRLPPGQRNAVELYYLAEFTQAETAERLGIAVGAVKTRLHKARASLGRSLADHRPERRTPMTTAPELIPMTIGGVRRRRDSCPPEVARHVNHVIMLDEAGGDRRMWIGVGRAEATALAITLNGAELPRPMTYQFAAALLTAAGARLREVRVTGLQGDVFIAQAVLSNGAVVDARPSDALNLAALDGVPVRVAADILDGYTRARARAVDPPLEDRLFTAFDPRPPFRPPRTRPSG